jgi:hypothetical protein
MDFEQEIRQVAKRYEEDGYTVLVRPSRDELPPFAADYEVDILAAKVDQKVIVVVKRKRADLASDPRVAQLAEVTNAQPGWRFDLVVVEPETPAEKSVRGAAEPTEEQIRQKLAEAEQLMQSGALTTACMVAWAGLEAAMRRVLHSVNGPPPPVLLRTFYVLDYISREELSVLDEAYRLRTQAAHGFVPAMIDGRLVSGTIAAARRLLTEEPRPESAAG